MLIIPAIDIINGKCVRLKRGDYSSKKVYANNPVKVALEFEKKGAKMLHIIDLDGARNGRPENIKIISEIRSVVKIPIEAGGGMRSAKTAEEYLKIGIDRIIIGTRAVEDINFAKKLVRRFGNRKIVIGIDVVNNKLAINGWQKKSPENYLLFAKRLKKIGVTEVVFTDISKDGMLMSPNFSIIKKLADIGFNLIASGGISTIQDIKRLNNLNIYGAIIGKALYEKKLNLAEAFKAAKPLSNLTKRIIPCLDFAGGKIVKGVNFKNLRDSGDPIELGKKYSDEGADELVFLDIKASKENRKTVLDVVRRISENIFIPFTVGGGIKNMNDIKSLLLSGADKVSINTMAVLNPKLISDASKRFGSQCVVVAIDAKKVNGRYKVFIKGGAEETEIDAILWAKKAGELGAGEILLTSIDRDGTQKGFDIDLLKKVSEVVSVPVIASGGAGSLQDLKNALIDGKADAVLAASLFHYDKISIKEAKKYLSFYNLPIRL